MMISDLQVWLPIIANVAIAGTFVIYWRQLAAMQTQVAAARDSSRAQNLISLVDYIQRPEHREARHRLIEITVEPWSTQDKLQAERVCSSWDVVGILLQERAVPKATDLVLNTWGYSIKICHKKCAAFIQETRKIRGGAYWDDFEWLAKQAEQRLPDTEG